MKEQELNPVTLETMANGAASELFSHELKRVIENIQDPNTETTKARKITIDVVILPSKDREMGEVSVTCKSNLAHVKPVSTSFFLGREKGRAVAYQKNPREPEFNFENVSNIKEGNE